MKPLAAVALLLVPWILGAAAEAPPQGETTPSSDLHRGAGYPGAAAFVNVGTLTVVYPAGPGEPAEANRRSAEARARWLVSVYKNKVEVAADDQVTQEQKTGNLLLLGWTNRILGSSELARPFLHDASGTLFLGLKETNPDVDLLVFHRNPLNWTSFILFWSRVDPERDRFQVLPRIGSDWAMYRDFQPTRQGMFKPGRVWPPLRDATAEVDHTHGELAEEPGNRATLDSPRYHASYDRSKIPEMEVTAILNAREAALTKAIAALGSTPEGFRILLYIYDDETAKRDATGVGDPTHSVPSSRELYMVRRYARSTSPHEEVHILARALYGPCFSTAVYEGLALAIENTWKGEDLDTHAALLSRQGRLPGPAVLLDEERFRSLPETIGFPAAGAFMSWLSQAYGSAGVRKVYGWQGGGAAALAATLGTNEKELAASFAAWADAKAVARKNDFDFIDAEAEARLRQVSGDWAGMTLALKRALAAKPGDPQTMFNLASAQMRMDDFAGAEGTLKTLLGSTLPAKESRFLVYGHYQLGRVCDLAGRRAEALAEYDAVLALPDDHGSHDLARERKLSPATKAQLE